MDAMIALAEGPVVRGTTVLTEPCRLYSAFLGVAPVQRGGIPLQTLILDLTVRPRTEQALMDAYAVYRVRRQGMGIVLPDTVPGLVAEPAEGPHVKRLQVYAMRTVPILDHDLLPLPHIERPVPGDLVRLALRLADADEDTTGPMAEGPWWELAYVQIHRRNPHFPH